MDGDNGRSPMVVIPVPPPPPPPPEPKLLVPISHGGHGKGHGGDDRADGVPSSLVLTIAVAVLLLLFIAGGCVVGMGLLPGPLGSWGGWWRSHRAVLACPRPPMPTEGAPQFNAQQREIRELRREAFRGDFFAQLELARRYEGKRDSDKNVQDTVEAATWYALALANPEGYGRTSGRFANAGGPRGPSLYDDCREGEREIAYQALDRLLAEMSTDERDRVRNRATYVLSTEGAVGFTTLGRLHDVAFGPFGEPSDNEQAVTARRVGGGGWPDAVRLFERNGVDAYMYDYLAMQEGDQGAYVLLQDLKHTIPWPGFADIAEQRARRWVPPYEFYPPEAPESGVPHSDESEPLGETDRIALYRVNELPFRHLAEALAYLHVIPKLCGAEGELSQHDVATFQAMLGHSATGRLTPLEKVRAIQFAAINGSPHAQLVLAVMYAEGVGVTPDYARAFHWFEEADRQGSPEAKFAVASYFSEGLAGVADQQKAEAVVHQLDAALSGFRPSIDRLSAMLDRVGGGHPGWYGYARPEEDGYRGDAGPPPQGPPPGGPSGPYGPPQGPGYADGQGGPSYGQGGEDWSRAAGDTRLARGHHAAKPAPSHHAPPGRGRGHASGALARAGRSMTGPTPVFERSPAATSQTQGGSR